MSLVFVDRWRPTGPDEWSIGFRGRVISLRQDESSLYYRDIFPPPTPPSDDIKPAQSVRRFPVTTNSDSTDDIIRDYLNLTPDLPALYTKWASGDPNFTKKALIFPGIRILRQDPWETLIGFICSSNNNISRISQMMDKLCIHYGPFLGTVAGRAFHDFPTAAALAGPDVASNLERLGFGYRAKYISKTAQIVANEKGIEWLYGLANPDFHLSSVGPAGTLPIDVPEGGRAGYQTAHEELIQLHGVGPKVADCVCLMGLGWTESVPIDTHGESLLLSNKTHHVDHSLKFPILTFVFSTSLANCTARLQVRKVGSEDVDETTVPSCGRPFPEPVGSRSRMGPFRLVHSRPQEHRRRCGQD